MFWALFMKPLVGLLLFGVAYLVAGLIMSAIPEGRAKRLLSRRIGRGHTKQRGKGP